jgi:hypothetical protein
MVYTQKNTKTHIINNNKMKTKKTTKGNKYKNGKKKQQEKTTKQIKGKKPSK